MAPRPKKYWGQHFLMDHHLARQMVAAIDAPPPTLVIEIGPGKGILTRYLLDTPCQYVGVEIDPELADYLRQTFQAFPNFHLLEADFLSLDLRSLFEQYSGHTPVVIGNIPYNITGPILFKLFQHYRELHQAILMVQKEVARRITASPGSKDFGILAIFSQLYARVRYLWTVPAGRFFPRPQVDSAVVQFHFRKDATATIANEALFQRLVKTAFQQRRKMLKNSLSLLFPKEVLNKLPFDLNLRPEQVPLSDWIQLANQLHQQTPEREGQ
ncbi:MAG: ribosomal RNA small subunit methyltransferase A [Calditrichaeota bacterium]|nr:ribosomal RNA small subunit methyltransferase A [Calditrichota bacterium]